MITFVDTHAHIDLPEFDADRGDVVERALGAGVRAVVAIGFNPERWEATAALVARYPMMVRTVGLHPNQADEWSDDMAARMADEASKPGVVAVGEIGLDFYRDHADPERQRTAFAAQVALASQLGLPVVIHQRDAEDEVIEILQSSPPVRGVMHCFSGDERFAERCLDLGFWLGVGGVATYRSADAVRAALASAPEDRLVMETDAPYLAPQGHRRSRNEPAMVIRTAETLAEVRGVDLETIASITTRNSIELFGPALGEAITAGSSAQR